MPLVSISLVSPHHRPARDARALAQGRLSPLLALEVAIVVLLNAGYPVPPGSGPGQPKNKHLLYISAALVTAAGIQRQKSARPSKSVLVSRAVRMLR